MKTQLEIWWEKHILTGRIVKNVAENSLLLAIILVPMNCLQIVNPRPGWINLPSNS